MKLLRNTILTFTTFCLSLMSYAQEITVVDQVTQERMSGVKVYCSDGSVKKVSNSEGRFQLDTFNGCDTIVMFYPGFAMLRMAYNDLRKVPSVELEELQLNVDGVVVSVNRWEGEVTEVPNRVISIPLKDIELENPQTTADLLASSGYVYIQKSQFAGGSPQLRGYGTKRVMIVVDGVRMNNAIFRSGNLQNIISIDPLSLSNAEVLFGPGSVMYGSDAIGGVMEFTTKQARFAPDSTVKLVNTNLFSRYNYASNELTGHVDFSYGTEKIAVATAVSYSQFGDLLTGTHGNSAFLRPNYQFGDQTIVNENSRLQVHSGYDQFNALQKLSFRPKEGVEWQYGFNYATNFQDAPRYDRLTQDADENGELDYEEWYYGPQEWMMNRLSYINEDSSRFVDNIRIVGAVQNFKESRHDRRMGSDRIRRQFEKVDALSFNIDLETKLGNRTDFFYGIESIYNVVGSNAYREFDDGSIVTINPRYPNGATWQTHAVYASVKHYLNESWILSAGLRYAAFSAHMEFDTSLFTYPITETTLQKSAPSGNFGIVYKPSEKMQWYSNLSTGFRVPNIDDFGKVFDSEPGTVVVPNTKLKPEYAYSFETGFVSVIGSKVKLDGAVYGTYLQNVLVRQHYTFDGADSIMYEGVLSEVTAIQNESDGYTYGVQAGLEWAIVKGLKLSSTISYQKGFQYETDSSAYYPKAQVAPMFGRTGLRYTTRQMKLEAYWVYNAEVAHEEFPLNERNELNYALDANGNVYTPAWNTINFKASYFFNKHLSSTIGVENITDQLYRTYGSGISAPGRSYIFSLKVNL